MATARPHYLVKLTGKLKMEGKKAGQNNFFYFFVAIVFYPNFTTSSHMYRDRDREIFFYFSFKTTFLLKSRFFSSFHRKLVRYPQPVPARC